MKFYKISEEVVKAILAYLLTRPMAEVEAGVYALRSLEPIEEKKAEGNDAAVQNDAG